jgi:hypothetical protein
MLNDILLLCACIARPKRKHRPITPAKKDSAHCLHQIGPRAPLVSRYLQGVDRARPAFLGLTRLVVKSDGAGSHDVNFIVHGGKQSGRGVLGAGCWMLGAGHAAYGNVWSSSECRAMMILLVH